MAGRAKDRYSDPDPDSAVRPRRKTRGLGPDRLTLVSPKVRPDWFDPEELEEEQFEYENRQLQKQAERKTEEKKKGRKPSTVDAALSLLGIR